MLKKFLNGQTVTGLTESGKPFNGYISEKDGNKIVINENKKWIPLSKLKGINLSGRILHEELEDSINSIVSTIDVAKLQKAPDKEKEAVKSAIISSLGDEAKKNEAEVNASVDAALLKQQANNGTDSDTKILQKYVDENAKTLTEETLCIDAIDTQSSLEDFDYEAAIDQSLMDPEVEILDIIEPYVGSKTRDELIQLCVDSGVSIDRFEISGIIDSILDVNTDETYSISADNEVDYEPDEISEGDFDQAFDDYYQMAEKPSDDELYEFVCDRFNFSVDDRKIALTEADNNIVDALCYLAESKLNEATTKSLSFFLAKLLNNNMVPEKTEKGLVISGQNLTDAIKSKANLLNVIKITIGQHENGQVSDVPGVFINPDDAIKTIFDSLDKIFVKYSNGTLKSFNEFKNLNTALYDGFLNTLKAAFLEEFKRNQVITPEIQAGAASVETYKKRYG